MDLNEVSELIAETSFNGVITQIAGNAIWI